MPYTQHTANFGRSYAHAEVKITQTSTGKPAIVLAAATGGFLNDQGKAVLDANGNLSVYLDNAYSWTYTLNDIDKPLVAYADNSPRYVFIGLLADAPPATEFVKGERIIVTDDKNTERIAIDGEWVGFAAHQLKRSSGAPVILTSANRALTYEDNDAVYTRAGSGTYTISPGEGDKGLNCVTIWLLAAGTITIDAQDGVVLNDVNGGSISTTSVNKPTIIQRIGLDKYWVITS